MFTSAWLIFCISETNVFILRNSVIPWTVNDAYKVFLDLTKMSSKKTTTSSVSILTVASWRPLCDSQWPVWAGSQWFFMPWIWQSSSESTKPGRQSLISMHVLTMLYYSTITIVHLSFSACRGFQVFVRALLVNCTNYFHLDLAVRTW